MNGLKRYVCGFIFNENKQQVLLIRKNRPRWQSGYLNGIGGHVEENEMLLTAMIRECREETGILTAIADWTIFARLSEVRTGHESVVVFFYFCKALHPAIELPAESPSGEGTLTLCWTSRMVCERTIPNLQWLIPLAVNWGVHINDRVYSAPIQIFETEI